MPRGEHMEVYRDVGGGYRWRLVAANNEITATSESYTRRASAIEAANRTKPELRIWVEEGDVVEEPDGVGEGE
ncbi:MAG: DUF1508 domain-containing protein [Chloroflexi bacterium]|nr:DUF1508 domain-containing protein [Chloroflexota bacterium]